MRLRRLQAVLILGVAVFGAAGIVWADIVTNLSAVADTALFEPNPSNNLGGLPDFPVGVTAGNHGPPLRARGLVKFDLTQLPTNALITSAELRVVVVRQSALNTGSIIALHRLLVSWGEGSSSSSAEGSPAKPGEATWLNRFHPSTPWASPGGARDVDYASSASATNFVGGLGTFVFQSTPSLVLDVQLWLNHPETNFGWILKDLVEDTSGTGRRIASREDTGGNGPRLTVHYQMQAGAPFDLHQIGVSGNQFHFSFNPESNSTYAVEARDTLGSGNWRTLTNISVQALPPVLTITNPISLPATFYRVRRL